MASTSDDTLTEWSEGPQALTPVEPNWFTPGFQTGSDSTLVIDPYTTNYNGGSGPWNVTLTATALASNDQPSSPVALASYETGYNFHLATVSLADGDTVVVYDQANSSDPSSAVDIMAVTVDAQGNPVTTPVTLETDVSDVKQFRVGAAASGGSSYVLAYATYDASAQTETVSYQAFNPDGTLIAGDGGTLEHFGDNEGGESFGFGTLQTSSEPDPSYVYLRASYDNGAFAHNAGLKYETVGLDGTPTSGQTFITPPYPSGASSQELLNWTWDRITPASPAGYDMMVAMRYSYVDASGATQQAIAVEAIDAQTNATSSPYVIPVATTDTGLTETRLPDGGFALGYDDGSSQPLKIQLFDSNGQPTGAPLALPSNETNFNLTTSPTGQLVVEWPAGATGGNQLDYDIYNIGGSGATGATGTTGGGGSTGTTGAASAPFASTTTTQNPDGSTSITDTQGSYFKNRPYYSFTDTIAVDGTFESEVRHRDNGATTFDLFSSGLTEQSVYYDNFNALEGSGSETFVFNPGHGSDVVNSFAVAGGGHDVLSFASSDFHSIAAILHNTRDTGAGALITDPTGNGDTVLVSGVSKADLVVHRQADFKLHG